MKTMTYREFSALYCDRQEQTPEGLREVLLAQKDRWNPDGWMLLECHMLDSSRIGSLTILPYGPRNTCKEPLPEGQPISPRGLASDMSLCIGLLPVENL